MKIFLFFLVVLPYGCSQVKPKFEEEQVSVEAALNQAMSSYLLGCVEALKSLKITPAFPICRERATKHRIEIEAILRQVPIPVPMVKPL